eukprot:747419-Hanusia_phi.AAC.2
MSKAQCGAAADPMPSCPARPAGPIAAGSPEAAGHCTGGTTGLKTGITDQKTEAARARAAA